MERNFYFVSSVKVRSVISPFFSLRKRKKQTMRIKGMRERERERKGEKRKKQRKREVGILSIKCISMKFNALCMFQTLETYLYCATINLLDKQNTSLYWINKSQSSFSHGMPLLNSWKALRERLPFTNFIWMDRECGVEIILRLINRIGSRYIRKYFSPLVLKNIYIINSMRDEFF